MTDDCRPYLRTGGPQMRDNGLPDDYVSRAIEAISARHDRIWWERLMPRRLPPMG